MKQNVSEGTVQTLEPKTVFYVSSSIRRTGAMFVTTVSWHGMRVNLYFMTPKIRLDHTKGCKSQRMTIALFQSRRLILHHGF